MQLQQVHHVVALIDHRSLASAAKALGISQPALSKSLRRLESYLGVKLFERTPHGVLATEFGREFARHARAIASEVSEAERTVGAIRDGRVDLAVVPADLRGPGLRSVPLYGDEMVAVLPPGHPKAGRPWLLARDFLDETYVADVTRPEPGREVERFFAPAGVEPARVMRAGTTEGVVSLVGAGLGVSILTRLTVEPYRRLAPVELVQLGHRGLRLKWHAILRRADGPESRVGRVAATLARVAPRAAVEPRLPTPRRAPVRPGLR